MENIRVVLICGRKGVGKDTLANLFNDYVTSNDNGLQITNVIFLKFSDKLKDCLSLLFGWDRKMLDGTTEESRKWREEIDINVSSIIGVNISPRLAMETFATIMKTHFITTLGAHPKEGQEFWARLLFNDIQKISKTNPNSIFVISDCRFIEEYNLFSKCNTFTIYIDSTRNPIPKDLPDSKEHVSEKGPTEILDTLRNNQSRGINIDNQMIIENNFQNIDQFSNHLELRLYPKICKTLNL